MSALRLALDRTASARSYDDVGRLHVRDCRISKACVSPYECREIPDWQALGLIDGRTYQLLRDPDELRRAAPTFAGIPIFDRHQPSSAANHPKDIVVGSVLRAWWDDPWLKADLVFWPVAAIDLIESGQQRDLSCGYGFRVDLTQGTFRGEHFDGRMVDLIGNHLSLVPDGRVPGAMVGDAAFHAFHERTSNMVYPSLRSLCCDAAAIVKRRRARDEEGDPSEEDLDAPMESEDILKLVRAFLESVPDEDAAELLNGLMELKSSHETSLGVDRARRGVAGARRARGAGDFLDRHVNRAHDSALTPRGVKSARERFPGLARISSMG